VPKKPKYMMNSATIHKIDAPVLPAKSEVFLTDCMEFMKTCENNQFDLAVVDPPYGIDINMNMGRKKGKAKVHKEKQWDKSIPPMIYFAELFRVSKNQIIWGGNYFPLPLTKSWIFWDKNVPDNVSFADGELAWTSFNKTLVKVKVDYSGFIGSEGRMHPTQKPIKLYDWIYHKYAKPGDTILDTHLGSGSNRISANKAGLDFTACEIDKEYYDAQEKRYQNFIAQQRLF